MEKSEFFKLFRRRGFSETMEILHSFDEHQAPQAEFFDRLVEYNSYPNTYFRVKKDLLNHGIVKYKLNDKNEKVIFLTPKGKKIFSLIQEIEDLIEHE